MGWRYFAWVCFAVAITLLFAGCKAHAQPDSFCMPGPDVEEHLARYQERPMFAYWSPRENIIKSMFANILTGDWTLISVDERGTACTLQHGEDLRRFEGATGLPLLGEDEGS